MSDSKLSIIILAAGQGKRMRSTLPKVLHTLAGKPLLQHVLETARRLQPAALYVVYSHEQVRDTFADATDIVWVEQALRLGTGHAVQQAMPEVPDDHRVLVLYGDVPLIRPATLAQLPALPADQMGLLTVEVDNPTGYGRIVRDKRERVLAIVEEKDADEVTRAIHEINTGIIIAPAERLWRWLETLHNDNAQGEYYLTDVIGMAVHDGVVVETPCPVDLWEILGVNDRLQLSALEQHYQREQAEKLMFMGVTVRDPARLSIRGHVTAGRDVEIDINVILEGEVHLSEGASVGPHTTIRNSRIGVGAQILANCVIEDADIGAHGRIGPFARIRPETTLAEQVHIGNFVEIKKSTVGPGTKINHLSYVGDSEVGSGVNIGAGTITCNYDGANKHTTVIGDHAFIGSDSQLVAPVRVGAGATIGAGSTITHDAPDEQLTFSRAPQKSVAGWQRPVKKK